MWLLYIKPSLLGVNEFLVLGLDRKSGPLVAATAFCFTYSKKLHLNKLLYLIWNHHSSAKLLVMWSTVGNFDRARSFHLVTKYVCELFTVPKNF